MITYEVTARIDTAEVAQRYVDYMQAKHLRDVLASGCFTEAVLEQGSPELFRTRYVARAQEDVDRYLRDHTAALRKDFAAHFPTGVQLSREVWVAVDRQAGTAR